MRARRLGVAHRQLLGKTEFEVRDLVHKIGAKAIEAILESLDYGRTHTLEESLANEANLFARVSQTADKKEGVTAFKEKRRPNFQDQ